MNEVFMISLIIMGKGMLALFVVLGLLSLITMAMGKFLK
ncbi:MAG: sodium pump decarboxylase gamma subunit [Hungatella sp.]